MGKLTRVLGACVLLLLVVMASGTAEACAVCFQAKNDAARIAFIASTAAMTVLPLGIVGGLAWWVRRQFVKADIAAAAAAAAASPEPRAQA